MSESKEHGTLKITMEQKDCLVEVVVPEVALPPIMEMKEYMKNTGADMYARLYHMIQEMEHAQREGNAPGPKTGP